VTILLNPHEKALAFCRQVLAVAMAWLVGWLVGFCVGWLVGWLVGWFICSMLASVPRRLETVQTVACWLCFWMVSF
jgi:hypothetical protein